MFPGIRSSRLLALGLLRTLTRVPGAACVRWAITCRCRNVIIICPDRYRQPPPARVPPHPARYRTQPAAKRSPQSVKQPPSCPAEDETSSLARRDALTPADTPAPPRPAPPPTP